MKQRIQCPSCKYKNLYKVQMVEITKINCYHCSYFFYGIHININKHSWHGLSVAEFNENYSNLSGYIQNRYYNEVNK